MVQLISSLLIFFVISNVTPMSSVAQDEEVADGSSIRLVSPPRQETSKSSIRIVTANKPTSSRYPNRGVATTGSASVLLGGKKYPLTYIDGCNKNHNIGFKMFLERGLTCEFRAKIHPHAVNFLNDNLHQCTATALKSIGIDKPVARVDIYSQGVFNKRTVAGSRRWSNHSLGAAIDMSDLEVEFEDGTKDVFAVSAINPRNGRTNSGFSRCTRCSGKRYLRSGRARFYDGFYSCIKSKVDDLKSQKRREGISCTGGALGCDSNAAHANHIHLSVPICPAPPGVARI